MSSQILDVSLSPAELVALRACYNASQKAFGAILGFGELTMNSYEKGNTPNPTNRLLLELAKDPYIFKAMYRLNSAKIGALQRKRIEESDGYRSAETLGYRMQAEELGLCAEPAPVFATSVNTKNLSRDAVLDTIRRYKKGFEKDYGIIRIGVFGSVARDEADEASDVDIVVEMHDPDLFYLARIKDALAKEFGRPVDIVNLRKSMNEVLKTRIEREVIYV